MSSINEVSLSYASCNTPLIKILRVYSSELELLNRVYLSICRYCREQSEAPSDFILSLWKIRYFLNNSLSPYTEIVNSLHVEIAKVEDVYWATSQLKEKVELFSEVLSRLSILSDNRKLTQLVSLIKEADVGLNNGICHKLFSFSNLVQIDEKIKTDGQLSELISLSRSSDLDFFCENLYCLTPLRFLGDGLISKIFYSGYCKQIYLLLYPGEGFRLPPRLTVESSSFYRPFLNTYRPEVAYLDGQSQSSETDLDIDSDDVWSIFHGGQRNQAGNLVESLFVVLETGDGTFLSLSAKVLAIRAIDIAVKEPRITKLNPRQLSEGDYVCLKISGTDEQLDELTLNESHLTEDQNFRVSIDDWRAALESLSLTMTMSEVAKNISTATRVLISPSQVTQWATGNVIGPRDLKVLSATVSFLVRLGALDLKGLPESDVSRGLWKEMSRFRSERVKAGQIIQKTIAEELDTLIGDPNFCFESIDANKGFFIAHQHLVSRISALDESAAFVPNSKINFIDKFGSPSWLE